MRPKRDHVTTILEEVEGVAVAVAAEGIVGVFASRHAERKEGRFDEIATARNSCQAQRF
jgi:hypothetical protein